MVRSVYLLLIVLLAACGPRSEDPSDRQQDTKNKTMGETTNRDSTLSTKFNSFDTLVDVVFTETNGSITDVQKANYDGFVARQDSLMPEILNRIFDFYKKSYPDYREGWTSAGGISTDKLEEYLPTPTTPENLKPFITPLAVYIQSGKDCKAGTIGIEFDCTWDIKSGLGVLIRDWEVEEAGVGHTAYIQPE